MFYFYLNSEKSLLLWETCLKYSLFSMKTINLCFLAILGLLFSSPIIAQNLQKTYKSAIKAFEKGNAKKGFALLEECEKISPKDRNTLYAKGFYQLAMREYTLADESFRTVLGVFPKDTASFVGASKANMKLENFELAEDYLLRAYALDSSKADIYADFGQLYMLTEEYETAENYLNEAIKREPKNSHFYELRAYLYYFQNDNKKATEDIEKSLVLNPKNYDAMRIKALILFENKKYKEVIDIYLMLSKKDAEDFEEVDFLTWAQAYYMRKEYVMAISVLKNLHSDNENSNENHSKNNQKNNMQSKNPDVFYQLAKNYFQLKDMPNSTKNAFENISKALSLLLEQEEISANMLYDRAVISHKTSLTNAKEDYLRAISVLPEIIEQKNFLGEEIVLLGDLRKLINLNNKQLDSVKVVGYQTRALNTDSPKIMLESIQKAIKIDSLSAYNHVICTFAHLQNYQNQQTKDNLSLDLAQKSLQKAENIYQKINPNYLNPEKNLNESLDLEYYYFVKGIYYKNKEDYSQAATFLQKAIMLNPDENDYLYTLAQIFYGNEQYKDAIAIITEAIDNDPENEEFYLERASYYVANEDYRLCLVDTDKVLNLDSFNNDAIYWAAMAYLGLKDYKKAEEKIAICLRFEPDNEDYKALLKEINLKK